MGGRKRLLGVLLALVVVLIVVSALILLMTGRSDGLRDSAEYRAPPNTLSSPRTLSVSPEAITALVEDEHAETELPAKFFSSMPASLAGAGQPAGLTIGEDGKLIPDLRLRRLFEHYLTAIGEEPLAHIVARIRHELALQLQGAEYDRAVNLLEAYLQYRNAVGELLQQQHAQIAGAEPLKLSQVRQLKTSLAELRGNYFDPDVETTFFGRDDAIDQYLLERDAIARDASLTSAEKSARLSALERDTPSDVIGLYQRSRSVDVLKQQERDLLEAGAPEETLFSLRESVVGTEAAERLAKLDEARRDWQRRLETYREELKVIESESAYPDEEKALLIAALREQHFSENERLRVEALDRQRPAP